MRRFRFGLIGSSDTHDARGGNGFKEHARRELTEARAPSGPARRFTNNQAQPSLDSVTRWRLMSSCFVEGASQRLPTGNTSQTLSLPGMLSSAVWRLIFRKRR